MNRLKGRDSQRTRTAVMAAAEQLFSEGGYAGTSMRDLAEASGVSQPLIHHHFGTKRELYKAVKQQAMERFRSILLGNGGAPDLEHGLRTLFRFFDENPRLLRLLSWARLEGDDELWPGEIQVMEVFRDLGADSQDRGEMRGDVDPMMFVAIVVNAVTAWLENREVMANLFPGQTPESLDDKFLEDATRVLFQGVATENATV